MDRRTTGRAPRAGSVRGAGKEPSRRGGRGARRVWGKERGGGGRREGGEPGACEKGGGKGKALPKGGRFSEANTGVFSGVVLSKRFRASSFALRPHLGIVNGAFEDAQVKGCQATVDCQRISWPRDGRFALSTTIRSALIAPTRNIKPHLAVCTSTSVRKLARRPPLPRRISLPRCIRLVDLSDARDEHSSLHWSFEVLFVCAKVNASRSWWHVSYVATESY